MGTDTEHKLCSSKDIQMWRILVGLLGILAFILVFIACTQSEPQRGLWATTLAKNHSEATIVSKAVRSIQATSTAKENKNFCLQNPLSCRTVGLDWERTRRGCYATVEARPTSRGYSVCHPPVPTPIPIIQPERRLGESLAPSQRQNLRPWAPRPSAPTVTVPRPRDWLR